MPENAIDKDNFTLTAPGVKLASSCDGGVHTLKVEVVPNGETPEPEPGEPQEVVVLNQPVAADYPQFSGAFTNSGASATMQIAPPSGRRVVLDQLLWSYTKPTDPDTNVQGSLSVSFSENTHTLCDITQPGPGFIPVNIKPPVDGVLQVDLSTSAFVDTARLTAFVHYED